MLAQGTSQNYLYLGDNFWVSTHDLPAYIHPPGLLDLYHYLEEHVVRDPDAYFSIADEALPVVLAFVGSDSHNLFPHGAEGYAGMCGYARWHCADLTLTERGLLRRCEVLPEAWGIPDYQRIRLVLVDVAISTPEEVVGFTLHELTHTLGTVDGSCSPLDHDYATQAAPAPNDAYWWFGVQGVFDLKPAGIAWDALRDTCAASDDPELCQSLVPVLADVYNPPVDP